MPRVDRTSEPVAIVASPGPLLTLSAPHPPWRLPWVTGSRHSRDLHVAAPWSLALGRASASAAGVLPSSSHRGGEA